jgi:hypothetical protein
MSSGRSNCRSAPAEPRKMRQTAIRGLLIRWSNTEESHDALLMFSFALITWRRLGTLESLR